MEWISQLVSGNPMVALIAACEVGFWVLLAAGLLVRYALRMPRLGAVLLVGTPVLDLVLLGAAVVDLRSGGSATFAHALGALYLGFSVAFGHSVVRWADQRVAHRFFGGPAPVKPVKNAAYEWREWGKCVLACGIAAAVILLLSFVVSTPDRTEALWSQMLPRLGWITGIWFVAGPLWTLFGSATKEKV